ncbi:Flp pilus assembly protein CpaB [Virgibacillus senegalensis]|uniref:Flp pilus assembly protein CpaB n=1 Tax=Virgibacillus senegalensis TaxID=1499679 RepID=UPI00069DBC6D|nr:Flp pilus assembly protein CpaB [Virgibacillus senegalensis]
MKPKKLLLLALAAGLITTIIFYLFLNQLQPTAAEKPELASVITASQDIGENQKITEEDLAVVEIPKDQVHPQAVLDKQLAIGKTASTDFKAGEVMMTHRLVEPADEALFISKKVQEGYRAVSISVDYVSSVSNLIEPGDLVDIVSTEAQESGGKTEAESEVLLQKVKVLAVGQRMVERIKPDNEESEGQDYVAVTLELKPKDAVKVIESSSKSSVQLVLHSKLLPEKEKEQEQASKNDAPSETTVQTSEVVTPNDSLIRSKPNLDAPVIAVVEQGTSLRYLNDQETDEDQRLWLRVETPEQKQGWVSSRIVQQANE